MAHYISGIRQGQKEGADLGGCYRHSVRNNSDLDQGGSSGVHESGKFVNIF